MNKVIYYLKLIIIFVIIQLFITFITSILNIIGINCNITNIILLISNIIVFTTTSYKNAILKQKKGILEGIKLFTILLITTIIIKLIFINKIFNITTFIYYLILFISCIFGALLGVNKKNNN